MEGETTVEPSEVNKHPKIIKEAQNELGRIDILVCGQCHMVFHFVEQFQDHRLMGNCSGISSIRENNINESKAQVWAFLLWKRSQNLEENENSWVVYQRWCKVDPHVKEAWVVAGRNVQVFTKLSAAKMQEVRTKVHPKSKQLADDEPLEEGEIKRSNVKLKNNKSMDDELSEDPLADTDDPMDSESELDTEEEAEREAELEKLRNKNNNSTTSIEAAVAAVTGADLDESPKKDDEHSEGENANKNNSENVGKKAQMTNNNASSSSTLSKKSVAVPLDKNCRLAKRTDKINNTIKESVVEKILAKRFNPRRKLHEYLIKWEGCPHDQNTWEPAANLDTCKHMLEAFEHNLQRQKEAQAAAAAAQAALQKQQRASQKQSATPGTSGVLATTPGGRPQRTSKQKALSQVKQWCGNITDHDDDLRQEGSSESEDDPDVKRIKLELDSGSEDEWVEKDEVERTGLPGRPRILSRGAVAVNGVAKKMTASEVAKSIGLASPDRPNSPPMLISNTKGVVKVYPRQSNLPTGVYMVNRKDGVVNVTTSVSGTAGTNVVRVVQKTATPANSNIKLSAKSGQSQVRLLQKSELVNNSSIVRLSPGMTRPNVAPKPKTTVRPAVRVISQSASNSKPNLTSQRMTIGMPQLKVVHRKGPVSKPVVYDTLDQAEKESESSEDDYDPFPKDLPPPEPDSPPREFTLDPTTGMIVGQAEGEPEIQVPDPTEEPVDVKPIIDKDLPEGVMIKEENDSSELVDQSVDAILPDVQTEGTTISLPETGEPLMITGEDGVVYRVAGQNEDGQTLLVAQGVDGEQQCVYVTTQSVDDAQVGAAEGTAVLTLDTAVAEAIDGATESTSEQLSVDTSELAGVEASEETDPSSQVVAQLVKAELPSPGGTRKVVLLLPDGNLLMTEVDAEQYEALELDK